jgi:hypothetical protein
VSSQLHTPAALPSQKEPSLLNKQEAGWAQPPFWTFRRHIFLYLPKIERSQNDFVIPITWILCLFLISNSPVSKHRTITGRNWFAVMYRGGAGWVIADLRYCTWTSTWSWLYTDVSFVGAQTTGASMAFVTFNCLFICWLSQGCEVIRGHHETFNCLVTLRLRTKQWLPYGHDKCLHKKTIVVEHQDKR